jgi:hypothetical protein
MADYVLIYNGGSGMAASPEESAKILEAWGVWYGGLGAAVKDGGNPFSPNAKMVSADGSVTAVPADMLMSGYSILTADSLDAATTMAKGCPVLAGGGKIAVFETFNVM